MHASPVRRGADLTSGERLRILSFLLLQTVNGVLSRGAITQAVMEFGRSRGIITKIYAMRDASSLDSKRKGRCGRRKKHDAHSIQQLLLSSAVEKRTTLRMAAATTKISASTLCRARKKNITRLCGSSLKPELSDSIKKARVQFSLAFVNRHGKTNIMFQKVFVSTFITYQSCSRNALSRFLRLRARR